MKTRTRLCYVASLVSFLAACAGATALCVEIEGRDVSVLQNSVTHAKLESIGLSEDGTQFVGTESGSRFIAWGFNYDHDDSGRLIEDYWYDAWSTVQEDFTEMKALGANCVRIHLQLSQFMEALDRPNQASLTQLSRLVALAERTGLYLDITGLGCYHKQDVPAWYDALNESQRWRVQAMFWAQVAKTCAGSHAIFCYDLMNEPILPGEKNTESEWLAGEFGGKSFVQRITLDLAGRTREQVARAWVDTLVTAIRKYDKRHLVTVGVIPWAHTFPNAKPIFYSETVSENLDFVSVHFYPRKGEVNKALAALKVYDVGKPIVIEETFPLLCGEAEFETFVNASQESVDGYIGFYWGKTIEEYSQPDVAIAGAITRNWLEYFRTKGPDILKGNHKDSRPITP
ncbi:MAG: glycoside hydrolase family 5 protein [Phycisphaerae bacterium]|nr:glycoside hydrolase family 5 protein [Phycisphaerae bacterium]